MAANVLGTWAGRENAVATPLCLIARVSKSWDPSLWPSRASAMRGRLQRLVRVSDGPSAKCARDFLAMPATPRNRS
jgi:hypothetical protein